jgi:hypothetical protein
MQWQPCACHQGLEKLPAHPNTRCAAQDNACCEEPAYRLQLVHAIPTLVVLDLHLITREERRQAALQLGHDPCAGSIAFWRRTPPHAAAPRAGERSQLELELAEVSCPA